MLRKFRGVAPPAPSTWGRQTLCELASAGPLSFGLCTYKGDFWCKRESDSGKFVVFFPLQGNASFKRGNETFESTPGNGLIADGRADSNVRFVGPRQHLVMIVEQNEMINRLNGMLETPARGPLVDWRGTLPCDNRRWRCRTSPAP